MSEPRYPSDQPFELRAEVSFESLHQHLYLKPSFIYRYADGVGTAWWKALVGRTHSEYFAEAHLGAVLTFLRIDIRPTPLMPQDELAIRFTTRLGRYAFLPGKPPRYGGIDDIWLSDKAGQEAAHLQAYWLWFHHNPAGKPGTIAAPPPLFPPVERDLPPHPQAPEAHGAPAATFRWTRRETDLNQHVNSIAFIERAENALADAQVATPAAGRTEVWYLKPGFAGDEAEALVEPRADGVYVTLRGAAHVMTVLRLS
jgi:hypothetical protein